MIKIIFIVLIVLFLILFLKYNYEYFVEPIKFLGLITRCKDEFFIKEFCDYYLSQGVDTIYVIDDDSLDKSIYTNITDNRVKIIYEKNIIKNNFANKLYKKIKNNFKWMIYCDVDEFITTKKHLKNTIKDELITTFKNNDIIIVPWVMMSSGNQKKNPESILLNNIYRWNHDKRHPSKIHKFRCRYNLIEAKCIFKTENVNSIIDHGPNIIKNINYNMVNSVNSLNHKSKIYNYSNLRESDIKNGYLLCYHYRIISLQQVKNKLKTNVWYKKYSLKDIMSHDYSEIKDTTLKKKYLSIIQ